MSCDFVTIGNCNSAIIMTPALSVDIKKRIVWLREEGLTLREIANHLQVSIGVVHKTLAIHKEYGEYTDPSKRRTGRPQLLDGDDERYLQSLLESCPSIFLDEIKQKLEAVRNVSVSMATISRFLRSRDFTWKAVSRPALEANENVRTCYQIETSRFTDPDYFVFIDESHIDQKTARRPNGWSLIGVPPVERSTFLRGVRHSILPALTTEGIVALEIFEGSVNKERFIKFLRDNVVCIFAFSASDFSTKLECYQAPQLNPFPGKKSIVVVDNCSIHHDPQVKELIEDECGMCSHC